MFQSVVDVSMVYTINKLLKENKLNATVHTYSGCSACGLHLKCEDNDFEKAIIIIKDYLKTKFLVVSYNEEDKSQLYINSKFNI